MSKQLENLKQFYYKTDHKFIHRIICTVCGRFFITSNIKEYAQKYSILFKNKLTLSSDNLYDCPSQNLFQYEQFPQYNGMVLDKDGFNSDNTVSF